MNTDVQWTYPLFAIASTTSLRPLTNEINGMNCVPLYQSQRLAESFRRQSEEFESDGPLCLVTVGDAASLKTFLVCLENMGHIVWYGSLKPSDYGLIPVGVMLEKISPENCTELDPARAAVCLELHQRIMHQWKQTGEHDFMVTAAQSIYGKTPEQIRRILLTATIDGVEVNLVLLELLATLDLLRRSKSVENNQNFEPQSASLKTSFTDEEAFDLLCTCPIDWPSLPEMQVHLGR